MQGKRFVDASQVGIARSLPLPLVPEFVPGHYLHL